MDEGREIFLSKVRAFASATPADIVRDLAQAIERVDPGNWAYARTQILQTTHSPEVSSRLDDLLRSWRAHARNLSPQAVALALLAATETEVYHQRHESVELVWTGPDSGTIALRRTDQALLQVIREAQSKLFIVSFAVYRIPEIGHALLEVAQRGVQIKICVESAEPGEGNIAFGAIQALGENVVSHATIYRWPRVRRPTTRDGRYGSLHAKCAVADEDVLFISSANLTEYAMTLNMEMGVLIRGGSLPEKVALHFDRLIETRVLVAV